MTPNPNTHRAASQARLDHCRTFSRVEQDCSTGTLSCCSGRRGAEGHPESTRAEHFASSPAALCARDTAAKGRRDHDWMCGPTMTRSAQSGFARRARAPHQLCDASVGQRRSHQFLVAPGCARVAPAFCVTHASASRQLICSTPKQHARTHPPARPRAYPLHPSPRSLLGPNFHNRARISDEMMQELMELPGTTGARRGRNMRAARAKAGGVHA